MITEFKRDMYHNYLVISDENSIFSDYYEQVLKYNEITGHLKYESRIFDKGKYAYYEINGLQALSSVFEKHTVQYLDLKRIFKGIIEGINAGKEYLLKENDYILSPNMIFFEISKFQVKLCYFPGHGSLLRIQLHSLFEFFMNKVNYNDQAAVLLIYKLYMKSKEEACTMQQLVDILEENTTVDVTMQQFKSVKNESHPGAKKETLIHIDKNDNVDKEKIKAQDASYKEKTPIGKKDYNQFKKLKEKKVDTNKTFIEEISTNVNQSLNMAYHKMPFVSQRVEDEREILYYPLSCYILCIVSIVVAITLYIVAYKKRFIFQEVRPSIDPVKSVVLFIVLVVIVLYVCIKVFDKKHKVSKMVSKIDYVQPSLTTFDSSKNRSAFKNSTSLEPIILNSIDTSQNQELPVEDDMDEEERTVMLVNFTEQKLVKLVPIDKDIYDVIRMEEFPFFIGKLKTHTDVHIPSPAISRFHAKILKEDSDYFIMDLNSTNGTYVDGELIEVNQKRKIEHGNEIAFANIRYIFNCM